MCICACVLVFFVWRALGVGVFVFGGNGLPAAAQRHACVLAGLRVTDRLRRRRIHMLNCVPPPRV